MKGLIRSNSHGQQHEGERGPDRLNQHTTSSPECCHRCVFAKGIQFLYGNLRTKICSILLFLGRRFALDLRCTMEEDERRPEDFGNMMQQSSVTDHYGSFSSVPHALSLRPPAAAGEPIAPGQPISVH